jgi:putative transposase
LPFALKSAKQSFSISSSTIELLELMKAFKSIVNYCIKIGLETDTSSSKQLSSLAYPRLKQKYGSVPSYYRLTAITKAAGILASRKKSMRRGVPTKDPYLARPQLVSCYHFKLKEGSLCFRVANHREFRISLTSHTWKEITKEGVQMRSFTITESVLSISYRRSVTPYAPNYFLGVDRNASNVTCGNGVVAVQFGLNRAQEIAKTTRQIVRSFKRNDVRIRKYLASKYGKRRSDRVKQILHRVSKEVVDIAKVGKSALVFENIVGIRSLYKKGNYQAKNFRARMNSVPWYEIKRQIEYKAAWEGVPVIQLTRTETRRTSKDCPACGERLQEDRSSRVHRRELWCGKCGKWRDRDVIAVMNISHKGWLRFRQSEGEADEAMVQEPRTEGVLLKVDASKLRSRSGGEKLRQLAIIHPTKT